MAISTAVGLERVSACIGYALSKGQFNTIGANVPQRIAILCEGNTANQGTMTDGIGVEVTSAQQAGTLFGFGSPAYHIMRILRPLSGGGVGGIPTVIYPQLEASGAAAMVKTVTVTGTATGIATHTIVIGGRRSLDGASYDIQIANGDTPTAIAAKIATVVSAVLGSPVSCTSALGVATLTSKWAGLTANTTLSVDTNGTAAGVSYAVAQTTAAAATPSIATALDAFGDAWNTIVINSYGTNSTVMDALEAFNGIPAPFYTGRYAPLVMKPFVAFTGSITADASTITDARLNNLTIAIAAAPLSPGFQFEAAANVAALYTPIAQNAPQTDPIGVSYPDMPVPADGNIGAMATYDNRDTIVKKGCSTVILANGVYQVVDLVTTYHPQGEEPPQFKYVRNLVGVDFNYYYAHMLLVRDNVYGRLIASDTDTVTVPCITPSGFKSLLIGMITSLVSRGLITDADFSINSIVTQLSSVNPDRLEDIQDYKRTGTARIVSTTVRAGFNFGTV